MALPQRKLQVRKAIAAAIVYDESPLNGRHACASVARGRRLERSIPRRRASSHKAFFARQMDRDVRPIAALGRRAPIDRLDGGERAVDVPL